MERYHKEGKGVLFIVFQGGAKFRCWRQHTFICFLFDGTVLWKLEINKQRWPIYLVNNNR